MRSLFWRSTGRGRAIVSKHASFRFAFYLLSSLLVVTPPPAPIKEGKWSSQPMAVVVVVAAAPAPAPAD